MTLAADRRGSVALMTGTMAPVLLMSLALGVEVSSWSVGALELQRAADAAAWAGAAQYARTGSAQAATAAAADVAEINGVAGAAARSWNAATQVLADNMITAQMVAPVLNAADTAVKVTVRRSIAKSLTRIFPVGGASVTIAASAVAEVETNALGPQPCILALGGGVDGITTGTDVSVSGNADLIAHGCSLRSDDGISQNGSGYINAGGVYAGGTISPDLANPTPGTPGTICCGLHPNSGQIGDPYAANTAVQGALKALSPGTGSAVSVNSNKSQSISPGTYSVWNVKGTLALSPGTYYVNGDISVGAQGGITGSGVTIVTSGMVNATGGATLALSAPTKDATNGIPGIVIAGAGRGTMSVLGNSTSMLTGLIYLPAASLKFGGDSSAAGTGCTEVIATTVTLVGTTDMAANCSGFIGGAGSGMVPFTSNPGPPPVALVQ